MPKRIDTSVIFKEAMGFASEAELVQWAVDALVAGVDSPSLRILAGLLAPFDPVEVRGYYQKALRELDLEPPSGEDALAAYAAGIAEDTCKRVLCGALDPKSAAKELFRLYAFLEARGVDNSDYYIWDCLDDDIALLEDGYGAVRYGELTKDNLNATIRREAKAFLQTLQDKEPILGGADLNGTDLGEAGLPEQLGRGQSGN